MMEAEMTQNGKIFLVEGLDLAGKTSACKNLVARFQPRSEYQRNAFAEKKTRSTWLRMTFVGRMV